MFGRIQAARSYKLVHPGRFSTVPPARLFSIYSSQRPKLLPNLPGPHQKSRNLWGWSSAAKDASISTPPPPEAPTVELETTIPIPEETVAFSNPVSDTLILSDLPSPTETPPLNYGDLAALGLSHWTPAGLCQWGMELIQVSTGIPWFWTIVSATLATRLIILPLSITSLRMSARLAPHQPRLLQLREQLSTTSLTRDPVAVQRINLQQRQIYEQANVSVLQTLLLPFVQFPLSLGMFFGVRKMCTLPVEQLKYSGVSFWPDLTVPDPTYVFPLAMAVLINLQLSAGAKDMTAGASGTAHLFNLLKVLSVVSVPLLINLPSGVLVYLITSVASMTAQTFILRQPAVRKALNIPLIPTALQAKPPTFMETVRFGLDWVQNKQREAKGLAAGKPKRKY